MTAEQQRDYASEIAAVLVAACRADLDVGVLVAAAAQAAADKLGMMHAVPLLTADGVVEPSAYEKAYARGIGAGRLVRGRPGSWEASLVLDWAKHGGTSDPERTEALAQLLAAMGQEYDPHDGGDILSAAMGEAVTELGSMAAFAAGSEWEDQLRNIGGQYADVPDR